MTTTASEPVADTTAPRHGRIDGVDVARAVAILGMVTVHFGPRDATGDTVAGWIYGSFYGKASVLFVVVAGIGIALLSGRRPATEVRARLLYRTVWLLPLGLGLQALDHPVAVILQYYALYFLFAVPFVDRRGRTLLAWAGLLLPLGSALVLTVQVLVPEWVVPLRGSSPFGVPGDLLLFGYYPVVTWLPPLLFGMWLGDRDLRDRRLQWSLLLVGTGALAVTTWLGTALQTTLHPDPAETSWWFAFSVAGHSEMPLAVLGATGFAVAVLGASLLAVDAAPRLLWPLAALGRLALSVYAGHLVVYALVPELFRADDVAEGVRTVLAFGAVTAAASAGWLRWFRRGPLEAAARWPWEHAIAPALRPVPRPIGHPREPLDPDP